MDGNHIIDVWVYRHIFIATNIISKMHDTKACYIIQVYAFYFTADFGLRVRLFVVKGIGTHKKTQRLFLCGEELVLAVDWIVIFEWSLERQV